MAVGGVAGIGDPLGADRGGTCRGLDIGISEKIPPRGLDVRCRGGYLVGWGEFNFGFSGGFVTRYV